MQKQGLLSLSLFVRQNCKALSMILDTVEMY